MAKKCLTHQQKVVIITLVTLAAVIIGMITFYFYSLFHTFPTARRKMLAYYRDDSNYIEVPVTLINTDKLQTAPQKNQKQFYISVEYDDSNEEKMFDVGGGFSLPVTVYTVLIENGFKFKDGVRYIVTAAPRIWWDGGTPFAVGIKSDNGQIYLDYETGKEKLLYYIENVMD